MISLKNVLLLSALILIVWAQVEGQDVVINPIPVPDDPETAKQEEVTRQEQAIRHQNNMSYTNLHVYNFKLGPSEDFVLKPSTDHEYKMEIHVYWKDQSSEVYVTSKYREGEDIRVMVYEDNRGIMGDRQFYTITGLSFNAKKGSNYIVRFINPGVVPKLLSMILASPMQLSMNVTTKEDLALTHQRFERIGN